MNRPDFAKHNDLLRAMEAKYLWWGPPDRWDKYPERVVAQVMRYADGSEGEEVKRDQALIEQEMGSDALRYVVLNAKAGWFSEHAWRHWHLRLEIATGEEMPPLPQRPLPF